MTELLRAENARRLDAGAECMTKVINNGRQAIQTRYLGPTNTRGARIKAWCEAGNVTIPYVMELNTPDAHASAVLILLEKLNWTGTWIRGGTGRGYCFVERA